MEITCDICATIFHTPSDYRGGTCPTCGLCYEYDEGVVPAISQQQWDILRREYAAATAQAAPDTDTDTLERVAAKFCLVMGGEMQTAMESIKTLMQQFAALTAEDQSHLARLADRIGIVDPSRLELDAAQRTAYRAYVDRIQRKRGRNA